MRASRRVRRSRGSSFIEILVALAIIAVLMVGVLQMFSLALLTNFGSAARTDLLYKGQQVVENLRLVYFLQAAGNDAARAAAGVPIALAATASPVYIPYVASDSAWAWWGPNGSNVVEGERLPYRLSYTVEDRDPSFWLVTVTATPVDNPNLAGTLPAPGASDRRYVGIATKVKIVTYSAQIAK